VAQLTSNVVIMQTQIVDGQAVLVPVVYLAQASQQNMGDGPVIAAANIDLQNAQSVTNTAQARDQQQSHSSGFTVAVTGTPLDTERNLTAASSSGNAYQRATGVANEITASTLDTPSVALSYGSSSSSSTTDVFSTSNMGSTIRGAGNVTLTATGGALKDANGNPLDGDITVTGSTVTAAGMATFDANRNVTFQASTDQTQQSTQSASSSSGFSLASPSLGDLSRWIQGGPNSGGVGASPYNASSSSANGNSSTSRQSATVVTGNSVTVKSNTGDINVIGSGISGDQAVSLIASQGAINVLAGTDANSNYQQSSSQQIGDLGSNGTGTGFSVGVASSHSVQDTAGQTQSTIRSQLVSGSGDVTLDAKQDVTVQGSDLSAGKDLTLIGKDLNLDPGGDATQSSASQSSSQFGVTLALGGVAGNAVATINQAMTTQSENANNPRLAALDKAEAALSVYGDAQAAVSGTATALIKATVSIGGGTSHSESQSSSTTTDGSTLTAGGGATLIATGSGATDANGNATDGDISSAGTQITAQNVTLSAARDINLESAQDTTQQTSSNSSSSGSIGVGFGLGGTQNGFTLELAASGAKGNANGNSVTNQNTQITAANTVSITSGRDTNLVGAEVSGNTVDANVGRNLTITSPQDTNTYNSQQASAGFQASICVPPFCLGQTVSGNANVSDQTIKDNYQSVNQQSGIDSGSGGFDVNVGNHTQLDGGLIASSATSDKNTLSTQTFGFTNLQNKADDSGSTVSLSASTASAQGGPGATSVTSMGPTGFGAAGTSNIASGTTYAAVSPGTITVRGDAGTGLDSTAGLSRDTATANGSVQNTFNAQDVANDMAIQQVVGQVGMQVVGDVATSLENKANAKVAQDYQALADAQNSGEPASITQAQANLDSDQQQAALWGNDGAARIGSHAAVAALGAALGGGSVAGAVGGTAVGDVAGDAVSNATGNMLLGNIASGAAGAAAGGALGGSAGALSGANGALSADLYNRQLHPDEREWAKDNAAAFTQFYADKTGETITLAQAQQMLLANGYILVDATAANGPGFDPTAAQYISQNGGSLFTATPAERAGPGVLGGPLTPEQLALPGAVPTIPSPDYVSANGSGMTIAYGTTLNLHDGQTYLNPGANLPFAPAGSIVWGFIMGKGADASTATNGLLNGGAYVGGGCFLLCVGFNHSIGGNTAIEVGFGLPGVSAGTSVGIPVGGPHGKTQ
jgi:filamentous hemagglutinin